MKASAQAYALSITLGIVLTLTDLELIKNLVLSAVLAPLFAALFPAVLLSSSLAASLISILNSVAAFVLAIACIGIPENLVGYERFIGVGPFSLIILYYIAVPVAWTLVIYHVVRIKKGSD